MEIMIACHNPEFMNFNRYTPPRMRRNACLPRHGDPRQMNVRSSCASKKRTPTVAADTVRPLQPLTEETLDRIFPSMPLVEAPPLFCCSDTQFGNPC
jgi:hypothetical protein